MSTRRKSNHSPQRSSEQRSLIEHCIASWLADGMLASAEYRPEMGSTNSVALDWVRDSQPTESDLPRLVIADQQTAGRGRRGRSWFAQQDGLAFSLVVANASPILPLAVGVSVAETIEYLASPIHCRLKWPNDVLIAGGKVAGTLIERLERMQVAPVTGSSSVAVIGIGVNVGSSPKLTDSALDPSRPQSAGLPFPATSVIDASSRQLSRAEVLEELIPSLLEWCERAKGSPQQVIKSFQCRCALTNQVIRCSVQGRPAQGTCLGVDANGHLLLETHSGVLTCQSGEVEHVRPA